MAQQFSLKSDIDEDSLEGHTSFTCNLVLMSNFVNVGGLYILEYQNINKAMLKLAYNN